MLPTKLDQLPTPCLLLDKAKMEVNLARMQQQMQRIGCVLRPHVKTSKSTSVAAEMFSDKSQARLCVSTLREAEYFSDAGYKDIMYAVGIAPNKLSTVAQLMANGTNITIVLDNLQSAKIVARYGHENKTVFNTFIELDVDDHRSGVKPDDPALLEIATFIDGSAGIALAGVVTHAGESYNCTSIDEIRAMAEQERSQAVKAANIIRAAGIDCPAVSVGSTPTATYLENAEGLSEMRAGVFVFQDLFQAGLGVCDESDIALSVLATVIGHQQAKNWVITDAGWMAMSRDRGTQGQPKDQGYGVVCDAAGTIIQDDLIVVSANQEHGIFARRDGGSLDFGQYPIGSKVRILPNHACSTAAQYSEYKLIVNNECTAEWPRIRGW